MVVRFSHIITLPSGNLARDFRWESLGYGRVRVQYNYTDRRRAHQTARCYTVEFLNGKVETIQARSANGGRVEFFKTSSIINELLEMLAEFNEVVNGVVARNEPAKVEAVEQDDIASNESPEVIRWDLLSIAKAKGFNTVLTSVTPKDDIRLLREVHGLTAVQCPAQTREGSTCKGCRLCAKDREVIVVFGIHGAHKGKARKAIQIHQAKLAR